MVLDLAGAVYTLSCLWHFFRWALAKGILEATGIQENVGAGHVVLARSTLAHVGEGLQTLKTPAKAE